MICQVSWSVLSVMQPNYDCLTYYDDMRGGGFRHNMGSNLPLPITATVLFLTKR